jgi:hypothetical protein
VPAISQVRLAQGYDQNQPVALGEVLRHEPPARAAEEVRPAHVECQRQAPDGRLRPGIEQGPDEEKADADSGARGEGPYRVAEVRLVFAGDQHEDDLPDPDHAVGEGELGRQASERLGHRDRRDQEGGHRAEQRDPHPALLGIDDAGQPRVAHPRPPQDAEDQHRLDDVLPVRVLRNEGRALGDREDEDEVEEELERLDARLVAAHGRAHLPAPARAPYGCHRGILANGYVRVEWSS